MSSAGKAAASAAGKPSDRTGFLGARIPSEVEVMTKHLKDLDKEMFRKILKAVVSALEGKDCRESMTAIAEHGNLSEEQLSYIIAGMYTLLKEALRLPASSLKQEVFKDDLRDIRIAEEFIADFASVIFGSRRAVLDSAAAQQGTRRAGIADFRWRVDVAISTSSLARALQPSILMQMKLTDGNAHRFEVPVSKFQELRYNVALILKEMNDLEKKVC
ncbi:COMM domain-containing protein 5-like isoform X1 [Acipenser oxyrinchus oxyrinchus]|uniref:COMM domain-containing protein 5 n=1 Tax=Acipenser oxyrinchus oxyrinchus TaxID=40147 RepID=A0AAD8CF76_ACIOX|nr:COMM domain-containing protein 5-like isoform X1 [Acipenser oxyrinchus oxyrinchus]